MTKEDWKKTKLNSDKDYVDRVADGQLADEAWLAAQREIAAVAAATDLIGRGGDRGGFVDEMTKNKSPDDTRDAVTYLRALAAAWTEAWDAIMKKAAEEKGRSKEDSELVEQMIAAARIAIKKGTTIDKFADD